MNEYEIDKIKTIKAIIRRILAERNSSDNANNASDLWSFGLKHIEYMMGLEEKYFLNLRYHTYHFTGDSPLFYWGDADGFRANSKIDDICGSLDSRYIINEPSNGIGYHYPDGRFISQDIVRYQSIIKTLAWENILNNISYRGKLPPIANMNPNLERCCILEIGAGYGGLIHHLSSIVENSCCVIVDLPEMLLFSASYLTLNNPGKRVFLYGSDNTADGYYKTLSNCYYNDFILIPNNRLDLLEDWKFHLVLNVSSFQEMTTETVISYLDFIKRTLKGYFYSRNLDCYFQNKELSNLSELIKARFATREISAPELSKRMKFSEILKNLVQLSNRRDISANEKYTIEHEYICTG